MACEIRVQSIAGYKGSVFLHPGATVGDLKHAIQAEIGVPYFGQRLFQELQELRREDECISLSSERTLDISLVQRSEIIGRHLQELTALTPGNIPAWLALTPQEVRDSKEIVLHAVSRCGLALLFASAGLKGDREVVEEALSQNGHSFCHAAAELRHDRELVLRAVAKAGKVLSRLPDHLRGDREVVLAAVSQDGYALEFASAELQNDPEVVRAAVLQEGDALEFADQNVRAQREVALLAVSRNGRALKHVTPAHKADREIVQAAVSQCGFALQYASEELQSSIDIVDTACLYNWGAVQYAGSAVRSDREFMLKAVSHDPSLLEHAEPALKSDTGIVMTVLLEDPSMIKYADERFHNLAPLFRHRSSPLCQDVCWWWYVRWMLILLLLAHDGYLKAQLAPISMYVWFRRLTLVMCIFTSSRRVRAQGGDLWRRCRAVL